MPNCCLVSTSTQQSWHASIGGLTRSSAIVVGVITPLRMHGCVTVLHLSMNMAPLHRWKKAMDAVHRAKLLLLLADFAGVQSAVPAVVARYKVSAHTCCSSNTLTWFSMVTAVAALCKEDMHYCGSICICATFCCRSTNCLLCGMVMPRTGLSPFHSCMSRTEPLMASFEQCCSGGMLHGEGAMLRSLASRACLPLRALLTTLVWSLLEWPRQYVCCMLLLWTACLHYC